MRIGDKSSSRRIFQLRIAFTALLIVCAVVRLIALNADPPSFLDWSTGVQTDEGFYTLDARNVALFGVWAPGNFHDRLLSPILSVLQQGVFHIFGVGVVQARLISVVFGLATIAVFWQAMRTAYNEQTALAGAMLLGLAPPVVFFNRMALQETPTVFWLVAAFWMWIAATKNHDHSARWNSGAGVVLAAAIIFKALAALAIPAFAMAIWRREQRRVWLIVGFVIAIGFYGVLWYAPHHTEIARMAEYYRAHQFASHSPLALWENIRRAAVDPARGIAPYLLIMTPVPCLLALRFAMPGKRETADIFLTIWFVAGLAFCAVSSYAPDRYLILFIPALAGLGARGLSRLRSQVRFAAIGLFVVVSGIWFGQAWEHRSVNMQSASQYLADRLPARSVVVGEMAPALCLDTQFAAAPVQPGLSNYSDPVSRLHATAIVVTQTPFWTNWWKSHYPAIIQPSHRVATLQVGGRWHRVVDVYTVQK